MHKQHTFDLGVQTHFALEDFIPSSSNQTALAWLQTWPNEHLKDFITLLYGPRGSGKTHLCHIWQHHVQAVFLKKDALCSESDRVDALDAATHVILEDAEHMEATHLFHLINLVKERRQYLLLTSTHPANQMGFTLPDLCSRLAALPHLSIEIPDEALLEMVLYKQFSDRQLTVSHEVISYLLTRVGRSFAELDALVAQIDHYALEEKRNITVPLVRTILGKLPTSID